MQAPYEKLVAMIERELELAAAGQFAELRQANDERDALMASLPLPAPAWAVPALERAELMNRRLEIEVLRGCEALRLAVAEIERARRAARGYLPARHRRPRFSSSA